MSKIFSFIGEIAANIFSSKKNIAIAVAVSSVVFGTSVGLAIAKPHNCEKNYELVSTQTASCVSDGVEIYRCKKCDAQKEVAIPKVDHSYSLVSTTRATCTEQGSAIFTCHGCNDTYTNIIENALGHDYDAGEVVTPATCITEGKTVQKCKRCESTNEITLPKVAHNYTSSSTDATCTEDGITVYTCSVCSDTYQNVTETVKGHDYHLVSEIKATCTTSGEKVYRCSRCSDSYKETIEISTEHSYQKIGEVPVTCTSDGTIYYQCSNCRTVETLVIPTTGHNMTVSVHTEPSCTDGGYTKSVCTVYGCAYSEEKTVDALGHAYTLTSSEEASCTVDGVDEFTCSRCSVAYKLITQEKYGHDYVVTDEIKVSCTVDGKKTYTCTRCSDSYTENTGYATGHDHREVQRLPATCTSEGFIVYRCINNGCDDSYNLPLEKLEHPYELVFSSKATCTSDGIDVFKCSVCSDTYEVTTEKAKGHNYIVLTTTDANCITDGQITYFCTNCQDRYSEVTDKALGHDYVVVLVTPETCTSSGIIYSQCSRCNALKTEFSDPLGHLISESSRLEATCTTDGYIKYSCTRDGCTAGYEEIILKLNHAPANYATIHADAVCVRCNIILQPKLDNELGINYYLGYADTYYSTPVYTQDRTGHDLGNHTYYSTENPLPGSEIVFNDSISLEDFYSHILLTSKPVKTNDGKHYYVDGGFGVSFDFRTLINESFDNGEMNIQQYSDFLLQFESDSMLKLVKEGKSSDKYYTIYEVVDFAYSTIEVAKLVDGKYVTVAIIDNPETWEAVWSLDEIILSDANGRMFFDSGTYRVMFKFNVAWFIESPNGVIYDGTGSACYPYGILNDRYDYFYVTVNDDTYNVLVPDDVDESRDLFYQISLDDIKGGAPFLKSGDSVDVEDNIDVLFDSKIGSWNGQVHYNGNVLTDWTMSYYLYDLESDSYVVQSSYDLFATLDANGVGKIKISKSNQIGDCKITVSYTLTDEATGVSTTYVDVYYLNIS